MRLIVVIGYPEDSRSSEPFPVYAGRDSAAAEAAMGQSTAVLFDIMKNPTVVRKRNKAVIAATSAAEPVTETAGGADGPIGEPGPEGTEGVPATDEPASAPAPAKTAPAGAVSGKRGRA
jgi:hypothetical protein